MNGTNYEVRPVLARDIPQMADLLNGLIRAGGTTALESSLTGDELNAWVASARATGAAFVAVGPSKEVKGFQLLDVHEDVPRLWRDIATYICPSQQRVGIGAALFTATLARAREVGVPVINATISSNNAGGLSYYAKMGFKMYHPDNGASSSHRNPNPSVSMRFLVDLPSRHPGSEED